MRVLRTALLVVGAVLLAWLVVRFGAGAIASSLARVAGWQLGLICLVHGLAMAIDTLGWRYAFAGDRVPFRRLLAARIAGEAVNVVSVVATIGGEAMKAWLIKDDKFNYYEKRWTGGIRLDLRHGSFEVSRGWAFDRFYFIGEGYSDRRENRVDVRDGPFVVGRLPLRF